MSLEMKIDKLTNVIEELIAELKNEGAGPAPVKTEKPEPTPDKKPVVKKKPVAKKAPEPEDEAPTIDDVRGVLAGFAKATSRDNMIDVLRSATGKEKLPEVTADQYRDVIDAVESAEKELAEAA